MAILGFMLTFILSCREVEIRDFVVATGHRNEKVTYPFQHIKLYYHILLNLGGIQTGSAETGFVKKNFVPHFPGSFLLFMSDALKIKDIFIAG
jgi:choline kinase